MVTPKKALPKIIPPKKTVGIVAGPTPPRKAAAKKAAAKKAAAKKAARKA